MGSTAFKPALVHAPTFAAQRESKIDGRRCAVLSSKRSSCKTMLIAKASCFGQVHAKSSQRSGVAAWRRGLCEVVDVTRAGEAKVEA